MYVAGKKAKRRLKAWPGSLQRQIMDRWILFTYWRFTPLKEGRLYPPKTYMRMENPPFDLFEDVSSI